MSVTEISQVGSSERLHVAGNHRAIRSACHRRGTTVGQVLLTPLYEHGGWMLLEGGED